MNKFIYNNGVKGGYPYVGVRGAQPRSPYIEGEVVKYTEILYNKNAAPVVETAEALTEALSKGGRAYVASSIALTAPIAVANGAKTVVTLKNGATISCSSTENKGAAFRLDSKDSTLVIEGEGEISSEIGVWAEKGTVEINNGTFGNSNQCVRLFNNVQGQSLENVEDVKLVINGGKFEDGLAGVVAFGGTIEINGGEFENAYYSITGNGTDGWNNVNCVINGGKFKATTADDCAAIYWPSKGKLTINDGEFDGAGSALYIKTGEVEINGGKFIARGAKKAYEFNPDGFNATGDVVVIDRCFYPGNDAKVVINDGKFSSTAAGTYDVAIYYGNGDSKELTTGKLEINNVSVSVYEAE